MPARQPSQQQLLILTDLRKVRVLAFTESGDDPAEKRHLKELADAKLNAPTGANTTDVPGKFGRGYEAGAGEAMSHAESKLDVEVEKRAIDQLAGEICDEVERLGARSFILAAPQEHLKRLVAEIPDHCKSLMKESHGLDLTAAKIKDLESRFL